LTLPETFGTRISVTADFTDAGWNTIGTHCLFTVVGKVLVRIIGKVEIDLVPADSNLSVGPWWDTDGYIPVTVAGALDSPYIWVDASPARYEAEATVPSHVQNGGEICLEITGAALTAGQIEFELYYTL